jgi:hypothetical protein
MRVLLTITLAAGALTFDASRSAYADWCAYYDEYTYSCGFRTFEQCLETIRGVGGVCRRDRRAPSYRRQKEERERQRWREQRR